MTRRRTVIVTGAGTGIGQATARRLEAGGWRVFATLRRPDPNVHGPDALALDVTDDESVAAAVAAVLERTGRIDAVVNNAGVDMLGAVEETSANEALALFQTNFFGVHRMVRAVLPAMRASGGGHVVTIGSIAGFLPMPFDAFYSASKHALEGYIETLTFEVAPFGIRCVLIEPGFIKTELSGKRREVADRLDAYAKGRAKVRSGFEASIRGGLSSDQVAKVVEQALMDGSPTLRQRVGVDAHALAFMRRFMPNFIFRIGMKHRY